MYKYKYIVPNPKTVKSSTDNNTFTTSSGIQPKVAQ